MPPASHPKTRIVYMCDKYIRRYIVCKMWRYLGVLLIATSAFAERSYIQKLLDTDVQGEELLAAYDAHYNALPQAEKRKEKNQYPKEVYQELLAHRKRGTRVEMQLPKAELSQKPST